MSKVTQKCYKKIIEIKGYQPIIESQSIIFGVSRSDLYYNLTFKELPVTCQFSKKAYQELINIKKEDK